MPAARFSRWYSTPWKKGCASAYDAVSRDVVGRWTYPLCPDVNALPRGVRVQYRARGGFPPNYVERGAKVSTEAFVGEGCVVAADAEVEAGATLVHSVIGRGAIVRQPLLLRDGQRPLVHHLAHIV